jgi:nitroreductase
MTVLQTIEHRTSYRGAYKRNPVSREDLIKIMDAGLAAPSGCNKQTTSLIAIDDEHLLKKLYNVIKSDNMNTAPAMICVLTERIVAYRDAYGKDRLYNVHDYSAAIENMLLAIVSLGYESCWYEGEITDADEIGRQMADILGVPSNYELICYLPVGVANRETRRPKKKPFEERAWFNGFGAKS